MCPEGRMLMGNVSVGVENMEKAAADPQAQMVSPSYSRRVAQHRQKPLVIIDFFQMFSGNFSFRLVQPSSI